jgi:hypothetical protein
MFATVDVKRFFGAWQALRTDGGIPHYRAVFDAMPPDLIPGMILYEQAPDSRYIVRFMGTALVDLWGEDLTGKDRLAALPAKAAAAAMRNLREIMGTPCGLNAVHAYGATAGAIHEVEVILLPVGNDPDKPRRVVGFGQAVQPVPPGGLGEIQAALHTQSWVDIGFGAPRRKPAAVFS